MRTSGGDLHRALGVVLAFDVVEVEVEDRFRQVADRRLPVEGFHGKPVVKKGHHLGQRIDRVDLKVLNHGGLVRVGDGYEDSAHPGGFRAEGNWQNTRDGANRSVQRQFADEGGFPQAGGFHLAGGRQQSRGDGKVQAGTFLANVGGGKVDGDSAFRKTKAGVADGGPHALAGFLNSGVGQSDDGELSGHSAPDIHFHFHQVGVDAVNRRRICLCERHIASEDVGYLHQCGAPMAEGARRSVRKCVSVPIVVPCWMYGERDIAKKGTTR